MNKRVKVNGLDINYAEFGKGKKYILLVHGWGQSFSFWNDLIINLEDTYHIVILDLPGFGQSKEPSSAWTISNYSQFLHDFTQLLKIENPIIIGHSFGGRIAISYAGKYKTKAIVIYSSGAGISKDTILKAVLRNYIIPVGKVLFPNKLYLLLSSIFKPKSYINRQIINTQRSKIMLETYLLANEKLDSDLAEIKIPTLIISGENDFIAGKKSGKTIHGAIQQSTYKEIENVGHFAHIEAPGAFVALLNTFLSGLSD